MSELTAAEIAAIRDQLMVDWAESREKTLEALTGIPDDELYIQPEGRAASLSNLIYHTIQAMPGLVNTLEGKDWHAGFTLSRNAGSEELVTAYERVAAETVERVERIPDTDWRTPLGKDTRGNPRTLEMNLRILAIHDAYHRGQIWYARMLLGIPDPAPVVYRIAQPRPASPEAQAVVRSYLLSQLEQSAERTQEAVKNLTHGQLYQRPAEQVRSVGQLLRHIVNGMVSWCTRVRTGSFEGIEIAPDASLDELLRRHEYTRRECETQMYVMDIARWREPIQHPHRQNQSITPEWVVWHLLEHEVYHQAQIFYTLQVLGIEEPSFVVQH